MTKPLPLAHNASPLEMALAKALAMPDDLQNLPDTLENRLKDPADEDLPFLIWEWGLQPILPYIADPRQALKQGRIWQKKRGTIEAGHIARAWVGVEADHEQDPRKAYHLHLKEMPTLHDLNATVELSKLSQSLRNNLYRITYDYDVRAGQFANSQYGNALFGIDSGHRPDPNGPVYSILERIDGTAKFDSDVFAKVTDRDQVIGQSFDHVTYGWSVYGDQPTRPIRAKVTISTDHGEQKIDAKVERDETEITYPARMVYGLSIYSDLQSVYAAYEWINPPGLFYGKFSFSTHNLPKIKPILKVVQKPFEHDGGMAAFASTAQSQCATASQNSITGQSAMQSHHIGRKSHSDVDYQDAPYSDFPTSDHPYGAAMTVHTID